MLYFFNAPPTSATYPLSLHDALPIYFPHLRADAYASLLKAERILSERRTAAGEQRDYDVDGDRKSTRLNSSHRTTSYAVFCLKKKKTRSPMKNGTGSCWA